MTAPKRKRKQTPMEYNIEFAIDISHDRVWMKRLLRKLVRDAVLVSWHRAGDESTEQLAKRIAKELIP